MRLMGNRFLPFSNKKLFCWQIHVFKMKSGIIIFGRNLKNSDYSDGLVCTPIKQKLFMDIVVVVGTKYLPS